MSSFYSKQKLLLDGYNDFTTIYKFLIFRNNATNITQMALITARIKVLGNTF